MLGKLHVIKAGPLTLLHDLGRYGFSHFGITPSGPLDEYAYSWANHLLANPVNCATLEITLGPAEFLLRSDAQLAIAGGDLNATLDGRPIANWSRFYAKQDKRCALVYHATGYAPILQFKVGLRSLHNWALYLPMFGKA